MNIWPIRTFPARTVTARPAGRVVAGGQSISGQTQSVRTDGGGLFVTFNRIWLRTPDQMRAWLAWDALLDEGAEQVIVPICDLRLAPRPIVDGVAVLPGPPVPHSDETYFSDDTGYVTPIMSAVASESAALRATSVSIEMLVGSAWRGGETFAIEHAVAGWRMYRVGKVLATDGAVQTLSIRPPLREAITAGTVIEIDQPRGVMKLATPGGMALPEDGGRTPFVDVTFVEAF
jgi:hypothetical protein